MLHMLDVQPAPVTEALLAAAQLIIGGSDQAVAGRSTAFLRRGPKWYRHSQDQEPGDYHGSSQAKVGSSAYLVHNALLQ